MAQSRRGETIFRRRPEEGERFFSDMESLPPGTPPADQRRSQPAVRSQRAAMMFDTEPGQAEQAYSRAAAEPEPGYVSPKKLGFWKTLGAIGLGAAAGRGADVVSRNVFDVPEERAREDYARNVGAHRRRIGGLKEGADLERQRREARNTALFRSTTLNYQGARNSREEKFTVPRINLLTEQTKTQRFTQDAQKALAEQRRRPNAGRSPFSTYNPGQGTYSRDTGEVLTPADPAAARAARPAGVPRGTTANADARTSLGVVQRRIKDTQDQAAKRLEAIDNDYSLDNQPSMRAISKQRVNEEARAELEKLKRQEEHLLRQMQILAPAEAEDSQEDDGFSEPDESDSMEADSADMQDEEEAAAPTGEENTDLPIGAIYRNPSTGERIQWDGSRWVPAR
jgi:hypothetical protein